MAQPVQHKWILNAKVVSQLRTKELVCPEERSVIWESGSKDLDCDKISYKDAKFLEKVNSETKVTEIGHYEMLLLFNEN